MNIAPRWRKLLGDVRDGQGRLIMMVAAIAVGVFAVTSMTTGYTILKREIRRGYLATNPAAALLEVSGLDARLLEGARSQPGVTGAEASGRLRGRIEVRPNEWLPLLLFVTPEPAAARIATVSLGAGRWPATAGEVVLEQTALAIANSIVGGSIEVELPGGSRRTLKVTGTVHDASLAPAWQEQTVYGYLAPATIALLGGDPSLPMLKLTVRDPAGDRAGLERTAVGVAQWLAREGHPVSEIRIPPYHHPHESQMTSVVKMLLVFSILTLILSAVLTGTLTASLLAPQVRQIAVMKAVGARSGQILVLYAALVLGIGVAAVGIGLPLGIAAGRALAGNAAGLLNLELADLALPTWLYVAEILAGVGIPLLAALVPMRAATRRPVRESLNDFGVGTPSGRSPAWLRRLPLLARDAALVLAFRNSLRRRGRLALTLGLLATAGALFMTSLNVKAAWQQNLVEATAERHFDAEIYLSHPQSEATALAAVRALAGVRRVEPYSAESVSSVRADGLNIVTTYPDGGHGSLRLQSIPLGSSFVTPHLREGRWLAQADADEVVINEGALGMLPGVRVGDGIRLNVRNRVLGVKVVGVVREHLTPASVYLTPGTLRRRTETEGLSSGLRVSYDGGDAAAVLAAIAATERALDASGIKVAASISQVALGRALGGHLFILIFILLVMSLLMGTVGVLGLASAISTGVLERTREFAVLRAVGAHSATIQRSVIAEGVFIALLSVVAAAIVSIPLTAIVARVVGTASLGPTLEVIVSGAALPIWTGIVVLAAAAASAVPAWRASRLTIRAALAYQ